MENKVIERPKTSFPVLFENAWMDNFFTAPLDTFFNMGKVMNVPAVNVFETEKEFKLLIAAPGMDKKDFKLEVFEDLLTISAEKKKEEKEENARFNRREYNFTSWSRSFTLPENCDATAIDAVYNNGELKIIFPKKEVKQPKKVKNITVN